MSVKQSPFRADDHRSYGKDSDWQVQPPRKRKRKPQIVDEFCRDFVYKQDGCLRGNCRFSHSEPLRKKAQDEKKAITKQKEFPSRPGVPPRSELIIKTNAKLEASFGSKPSHVATASHVCAILTLPEECAVDQIQSLSGTTMSLVDSNRHHVMLASKPHFQTLLSEAETKGATVSRCTLSQCAQSIEDTYVHQISLKLSNILPAKNATENLVKLFFQSVGVEALSSGRDFEKLVKGDVVTLTIGFPDDQSARSFSETCRQKGIR